MINLCATNFLALGISFRRIDQNQKFFQQIYKRGSYTDAAYAFATYTNEQLISIGEILYKYRAEGLPQQHTEKKVRSFVSRFNALVHRAMFSHPTHSATSILIKDFSQLIRSIETSRIVLEVKHYLRRIVEYFFLPYLGIINEV